MVANLVENAIKYGAGEERKIWIETGCHEDGVSDSLAGPSGWLRVEDHGPGIAAEHLYHLFDRFYRADPARAVSVEVSEAGNGLIKRILQIIEKTENWPGY